MLVPCLAVIGAAIWSHRELDGLIGVLVASVVGCLVIGGLGWVLGSKPQPGKEFKNH